MKKFAALTLLFALTACGGYETLETPFNFRGMGVNLFGSDSKMTEANTFEVVVNAPAGTTEETAQQLFDTEANKVCKGKPYTKQVTAAGLTTIREFGVKGVDTRTVPNQAPSLRGYVKCQG